MNEQLIEFETELRAEKNFGKARLADKRRAKRLVSIAAQVAKNNGQSLARLYDKWYDVIAVYNLINLDIITPELIQQ